MRKVVIERKSSERDGWRPGRFFRSARGWIVLGVLAPLGMLLLSAMMLLELRRDAWDKAEQTSQNLLQVIERDIARNVEIIDLSMHAVIDNLKAPGLAEVSLDLRQLVLFDRAVTASNMGAMLVLDENGDSIIDADAVPARRINNADRSYFQAHKARADLGLVISPPLMSRLLSQAVIVLSRRIDKPDGSFGGVVLASLKLSYFCHLFDRIGLGRDGGINLYLRDGTRLMRHPSVEADIGANIAGAPTFERFLSARNGHFIGTSVRDGVERSYAFTQVADLPLILNVALSTREIEAEWREKALVIGLTVLALCGLTIALSLLFGRELRRSAAMQAELARLSLTDSLTGLPNRRRFEEGFAEACQSARRTGRPLALLVIDVDHFKRINDRYGHAVGDAVLKGLAGCLGTGVCRPGDLTARVGGEEFIALLPETEREGALHVARAIHAAVGGFSMPSADIPTDAITVSIGIAVSRGGEATEDLYRRADAALYDAKASGRNQTRFAPPIEADQESPQRLRLAAVL